MMCPPSVKLSENFADTPSTYAEEGTFLHELCELKLHSYLGDMTSEVIGATYARLVKRNTRWTSYPDGR